MSWFIIGISGVTCGGKTTLATRFLDYLSDAEQQKELKATHNIEINKVRLIHQDRYFYARDSPHHVWVNELNFINRELLSALDQDAMHRDIDEILGDTPLASIDGPATAATTTTTTTTTTEAAAAVATCNGYGDNAASRPPIQLNILLIEGFLIFNDAGLNARCHLKFFFHLTFDTCWTRRRQRVFKHVNPHPERYFREILWPSYKKHLNEIDDPSKIIFLNGELNLDDIFKLALRYFVETVS